MLLIILSRYFSFQSPFEINNFANRLFINDWLLYIRFWKYQIAANSQNENTKNNIVLKRSKQIFFCNWSVGNATFQTILYCKRLIALDDHSTFKMFNFTRQEEPGWLQIWTLQKHLYSWVKYRCYQKLQCLWQGNIDIFVIRKEQLSVHLRKMSVFLCDYLNG